MRRVESPLIGLLLETEMFGTCHPDWPQSGDRSIAEQKAHDKCCALVTVNKGVITRDTESIGGSELTEVDFVAVIAEKVLGAM